MAVAMNMDRWRHHSILVIALRKEQRNIPRTKSIHPSLPDKLRRIKPLIGCVVVVPREGLRHDHDTVEVVRDLQHAFIAEARVLLLVRLLGWRRSRSYVNAVVIVVVAFVVESDALKISGRCVSEAARRFAHVSSQRQKGGKRLQHIAPVREMRVKMGRRLTAASKETDICFKGCCATVLPM